MATRPEPAGSAIAGVRPVDLDWHSVAWAMGAFVALVAATNLVRSAPRALTVLAVGTLLALGLDPLVTRVQRRLDCRRGMAVALVMVGIVAVASVVIALLAPKADQAMGRRTGH